ncbi:HisA/HisF-related TIM barrel protein, partial [Christensenella sp.]|uniref:HisA/HisF-related TIM barrel protein n=1 Tax=Christensenella sp. TaxID=1935934 RepID=UPI003FA4CECA
ETIVKKTWVNLIASGGVSSLEDLHKIKGTGACGCIIGKALYDGAFTLEEALKAAK